MQSYAFTRVLDIVLCLKIVIKVYILIEKNGIDEDQWKLMSNGIVWNGVEWSDMEWNGVKWRGGEQIGIEKNGVEWIRVE